MPNAVKHYFGIGVAVLLLVVAGTVASAEESKSLQDVVSEIRQSQGLKADQSIDCNKVTDSQYEAVGEAWMDVMVPDPQRHAMMDRMMGGPGSESLANAHRMMGARYLGCISSEYYGNMMGGMMGGMMMPGGYAGYGAYGGNMMGYGGTSGAQYGGNMMGGYDGYGGWMHSWGGGIFMWIIFIVVIGLIVYLIVESTRHRDSISHHTTHLESAQDILKKRYARGEISKEDYERMKKDIG